MADYDMQDATQDPWYFQAPGWAQEDGHDLPVSTEKPEIHEELQVVLDAAPLGRDHALLKERIHQYHRYVPIFPGYISRDHPKASRSITDRSYFGSVLMALFDLSPFLNFIEQAASSKACNDPIFEGLHALAQKFHREGDHLLGDEEWEEEVRSRTETLWNCIKTKREGPNEPDRFNESFCHALEFLNYLCKRLEHAQFRQSEDESHGDVNLSTRFKQLFKYSTVRHTPMRCSCPQPVLRRQPTRHGQTPGYIFSVMIPEGMNLEQAISQAMWKEQPASAARSTCPECGDKVDANDFHTFAYLPEVLFIAPLFLSKRYEDGYVRYTQDENFVYPERLDMSSLTDDPQRPGDQVDRVYKLQSLITCTSQNMDYLTGYKPTLRVNEDDWVQYPYYVGEHSPNAEHVTFEQITDPISTLSSGDAPHILMYMRERQPHGFGTLPDVVKHRQTPPSPNTVIHDKYGLGSSDLSRFLEAQDQPGENGNATAFESAKAELTKGHKTSHWIWFMFPRVATFQKGTRLSDLYAIKSLGEAIAYWNHPELKRRYFDLLKIVLESSETHVEKLFGSWIDAGKFQASLTLFALTCNDEERGTFEPIFEKFEPGFKELEKKKSDQEKDYDTVWQLYEWLHDAGEDKAIAWMHHYVKGIPDRKSSGDDGKEKTEVPARGGLSVLVTSPEALAYNIVAKGGEENEPCPATSGQSRNGGTSCQGKCSKTDPDYAAAKSLYRELMKLTKTDIDDSESYGEEDAELLARANQRAVLFGKLLLGYATPKGAPAPVETTEFLERARLLGRNLIELTRPPPEETYEATSESHDESESVAESLNRTYDGAADELALDEDLEPGDGFLPDDGYGASDFRTSADEFGLDSSSDELAEDGYPGEGNPHEAVAIPTDPNDPRIGACQNWTRDELKAEFQKEQLDLRGLRNDDNKHRMKFLKHFELERDYSIYHESRLRQVVKDLGIAMSNGVNKADKAELVDALTEYDTQRLGEMEFAEGEDSEQTDSAEFEPEEYQSSEAQETDTSSASEETPRPKKRLRDEYEDDDDDDDGIIDDEDMAGDYGDEDYDDEEEETEPRGPPKGPVRMRTKY